MQAADGKDQLNGTPPPHTCCPGLDVSTPNKAAGWRWSMAGEGMPPPKAPYWPKPQSSIRIRTLSLGHLNDTRGGPRVALPWHRIRSSGHFNDREQVAGGTAALGAHRALVPRAVRCAALDHPVSEVDHVRIEWVAGPEQSRGGYGLVKLGVLVNFVVAVVLTLHRCPSRLRSPS